MNLREPDRHDWDEHWVRLSGGRSLFGKLASLVRKQLLSRAVRHYTGRYFAGEGIFVEAGCGSGETAARIAPEERKLVGLDFSLASLLQARREGSFRALVCADIRHLPLRDESVSGIWNLGVMEHFHPPEVSTMLREFRRVLRPGRGALLLFWPPTFGLSRWVLAPFEWIRGQWSGRTFHFFPDEVNRLGSRAEACQVLESEELAFERADFTPRDGFNHLIVVGRRTER